MTATLLTPLIISLPIGMAALMAALGARLPRRVLDALATATAATVTVLAALLLAATAHGRVIAWAGGWTPHQGVSVGIALVADPIGAGLAVTAAALMTAVLVFSWRYFQAVEVFFHALMLVFLAAMCGFVLTGDLFDMFVWFELISVIGSAALPPAAVRVPLLAFGVLTATVGAVMCLAQRHLKRLLAFSTISHVGLLLIGVALLRPAGLAGTAIYVLGQAGVEAALFLLVGIILLSMGSVNERELHGRGATMPITATLTVVGGLALAGLPPFATGLGKAITEEAGITEGAGWLVVVFVGASALTGAAVLRMAGRVFFGLGSPADQDSTFRAGDRDGDSGEAEDQPPGLVPRTMLIPPAVLLGAALTLGVLPGLPSALGAAAAEFVNRPCYAAQVLGLPLPAHGPIPAVVAGFTTAGIGSGLLSVTLAVLIAALSVLRTRLPRWASHLAQPALPALRGLRALHSGHVGDYATWLIVGVAALGGTVGLILR